MDDFSAMLDGVYAGRDALALNTIYEDLVAAAAPEAVLRAVESMPEGVYRKEDVAFAISAANHGGASSSALARPVEDNQAYDQAAEDEAPDPDLDYRGPERADPDTAVFQEPGAASAPDYYFADGDGSDISDDGRPVRTGADQPWDPEDLAVAEGRDPTPENIERARRELEEEGPSAIERNVP